MYLDLLLYFSQWMGLKLYRIQPLIMIFVSEVEKIQIFIQNRGGKGKI